MTYSTDYVIKTINKKFKNISFLPNFIYTGAKDKFNVVCKKHGLQTVLFSSLMSNIKLKYGCPECGKEISKLKMKNTWAYTKKEIIKKIYNKFGKEIVDLSKFIFTTVRNKSIFICKIHNIEFSCSIYELCKSSRKCFCPACHKDFMHNMFIKPISKNDFINKSKYLFGDKFTYDELPEILLHKSKVKIKCKYHGDILVRVDGHYSGYDCKMCSVEKAKKSQLNNIDDMIKQCKIIHNNKYTYEKVNYTGIDNLITISCPKHGDFQRTMYSHLYRKHKCPKCSKSISGIETDWLNKLKIPNNDKCRQVKIRYGKTKTYKVDGLIPETNTVYEFLGDYYHGNPLIYKEKDFNKKCHKTFGYLYKKTVEKFNLLNSMGFKIIYIWESEFKELKNYNIWKSIN